MPMSDEELDSLAMADPKSGRYLPPPREAEAESSTSCETASLIEEWDSCAAQVVLGAAAYLLVAWLTQQFSLALAAGMMAAALTWWAYRWV